MQKAAWNRMVTRTMREQPNTTPVTTRWTADFLTREGEGRKAMGDWLHEYVVCVSDAERWGWNFWVENPSEAPQVTYKAACVDFKLQQPLERTSNVSSRCRRT
jgi:hypothetical protein